MAKRHTTRPDDIQSVFLRLEELIAASSGADVFETCLALVAAQLSGAPASEDLPGVPKAVIERCAHLLGRISFAREPQALDALFEMLVSETSKGRKGQYFTPRYVVDFCVRLARPSPGAAVVDPACGSGAFLRAAVAAGATDVRGIDIDERACRIARMVVPQAGVRAAVDNADALRDLQPDSADVILTNPPFAGEIVEPALLQAFELAEHRTRVERDVLFIEASARALRPGGVLAMVLPHNKFAGRRYAYVREWLLREMQILAVVGLGRNTFLPHTHQKANVLVARKRSAPRNGKPEAIFFAQSERDGKDTRGSETPHDLDDIAAAYATFAAGGSCA